MISRWLIMGIQLAATLLIVAALTSGFFVLVALMLASVFSPIQSIAAACAQGRVRIVAFCFASLPSLLMILALFQRQDWIEQCRISGCSGTADGAINAVPGLATATFIPFAICLGSVFWNGLGPASRLEMPTRVAAMALSFAPVLYIYVMS